MATLYQIGSTYYANYVNAQGTRVRGSLQTQDRETAEQALAIIVNEVDRERLTGAASENHYHPLTLNQFKRDYLRWREAEHPASQARTTEALHNHVLPEFGDIPMADIAPFQVELWKTKRRKAGAAPATIKKELDVLRAALNRAVKWELIPGHRIDGVSAPKILTSAAYPFYELDQLQAIYDAATNYGPLWKFIANTGLRRGEIMKARRQDIVNGAIRIESTETARTKSGKWRPVPLSPGALDALDKLPDDYLAPRIHINSLGRAFRQDAKRAGAGGSIHWLRHTFISHLVMNDVNLKTVQELAGHASFNTTLKYAHLSKTYLKSAVSGFDI